MLTHPHAEGFYEVIHLQRHAQARAAVMPHGVCLQNYAEKVDDGDLQQQAGAGKCRERV